VGNPAEENDRTSESGVPPAMLGVKYLTSSRQRSSGRTAIWQGERSETSSGSKNVSPGFTVSASSVTPLIRIYSRKQFYNFEARRYLHHRQVTSALAPLPGLVVYLL
jgi:hypothetical protein